MVKLGVYSSTLTSQTSVDGTVNFPTEAKKENLLFDFDLGASQAKSKASNTTTLESFLGFGVTTPSSWIFRASFSGSRNSSENLSTAEPSFAINKKIFYGDSKAPTGSEKETSTLFDPFFNVGFKGSRNYIIQSSATSRSTAVFGLQQSTAGLNLFWQPSEHWNFAVSGTKYSYDRDVKALYTTLGNYPFLSELSTRLTTINETISTLPESSATFSLGYILDDHWDFTVETQRIRDFISSQYGTTNSLAANWSFLSDWLAHLGFGSTIRSDNNEKSTFSEVSISYFF